MGTVIEAWPLMTRNLFTLHLNQFTFCKFFFFLIQQSVNCCCMSLYTLLWTALLCLSFNFPPSVESLAQSPRNVVFFSSIFYSECLELLKVLHKVCYFFFLASTIALKLFTNFLFSDLTIAASQLDNQRTFLFFCKY